MTPAVNKAHDRLSSILENPCETGNHVLVRNAAVELCVALAGAQPAVEAVRRGLFEASSELLSELEDDPEASTIRSAAEAVNAGLVALGFEPETLPEDPDGDA